MSSAQQRSQLSDMAQAPCPGIRPPYGSRLALITCISGTGGYCRSTAARLDFNSSNAPPVKHALTVSGTPVTGSPRFPFYSRPWLSGQPHSPKHGTPPRAEVGDPMMHHTIDYDGNKI